MLLQQTPWRRRGRMVGVMLAIAAMAAGCSARRSKADAFHPRLDVTLQDPAGHPVSLASFKGKPVILNFWATYCGPCKSEMPALNDLATKYRGRVDILGISVNDDPVDIRKFEADRPSTYPVLVGLGHDDFIQAYDADVEIPVSWVLRADGTVQAKVMGPQTKEWFEQQIQALLEG